MSTIICSAITVLIVIGVLSLFSANSKNGGGSDE